MLSFFMEVSLPSRFFFDDKDTSFPPAFQIKADRVLVMSIAGIIFSILLGGATLGLAPIILLLLNMVKLCLLMDNLQKRAPFGLGAIVLYLLFVGIAGIDNIPFVVHVERAGSYGLWIFAGILATLGLLTILLTIQIYHAYGYRKGKTALFLTGFPWSMAS